MRHFIVAGLAVMLGGWSGEPSMGPRDGEVMELGWHWPVDDTLAGSLDMARFKGAEILAVSPRPAAVSGILAVEVDVTALVHGRREVWLRIPYLRAEQPLPVAGDLCTVTARPRIVGDMPVEGAVLRQSYDVLHMDCGEGARW